MFKTHPLSNDYLQKRATYTLSVFLVCEDRGKEF